MKHPGLTERKESQVESFSDIKRGIRIEFLENDATLKSEFSWQLCWQSSLYLLNDPRTDINEQDRHCQITENSRGAFAQSKHLLLWYPSASRDVEASPKSRHRKINQSINQPSLYVYLGIFFLFISFLSASLLSYIFYVIFIFVYFFLLVSRRFIFLCSWHCSSWSY